jgi:hypothetical protein
MLHKDTTDGPRHQPCIDHSAVFSLLTSVARSVEFYRRLSFFKRELSLLAGGAAYDKGRQVRTTLCRE